MTDPNRYLAELNTLLSRFEADCNNSFTSLYGVVKHCKTDPKKVEQALIKYNRIPNGLLPDTERLCQFSASDLESEIRNNLSFNTNPGKEIFYRQSLFDTAHNILRFIDYITLYRSIPSEIERIYKDHEYNAKEYPIFLAHSLYLVHTALRKLYNVIYDINELWKHNEQKQLMPKYEQQHESPVTRLNWKSDKTDLAELVWALAKSGRITDTSTGKDITQKELAQIIATMFNIDSLDVTGLMKARMRTYKVTDDGNTFTGFLKDLVNERNKPN